ncbi:MAG TPA: CsbD family protein [Opitutaceae bacterium]|nr:CsbD family protein [Opitutaceae bacterium]
MKVSTRNKAVGASNLVKGGTKVAAGKVTGNRLLQAKGRAQELVGKIQRSVGKQQKANGE